MFLLALSSLVLAVDAANAGVTVVQPLQFGSWISKNNSMQHEITINADGSYTFDSAGFIEITPPQIGTFDLDGMTPNTAIASVVVTQITALSGGGVNFQMINLQGAHPASTNASGVARIYVNGTAQTSGNGTSYLDQTFNGQVQIQINF